MKSNDKSQRLKSSFILDALTSFSLISIILLIFLPILINQHLHYRKEIEKADMYRTLITVINRFDINELHQGIQLEQYEIKQYDQNLCITSNESKEKYCFKVQEK